MEVETWYRPDTFTRYKDDRGKFLAHTTIGMFPILYFDGEDVYCNVCAAKLDNITEVGIFLAGPQLSCFACRKPLKTTGVVV